MHSTVTVEQLLTVFCLISLVAVVGLKRVAGVFLAWMLLFLFVAVDFPKSLVPFLACVASWFRLRALLFPSSPQVLRDPVKTLISTISLSLSCESMLMDGN